MLIRQTYFRICVLLLTAVFVATCGRTDPPPKEDTTPPTVIAEYPSNNAINVSISTSISVDFSEAMDVSSIGPTTVLVSDTDSTTVQGDISCDGVTAVFTPKAPLEFSHTYVVTVTAAVRDAAGNNMSLPVTFVFTTGDYVDTVPPSVLDTVPTGTSVGVNAVIVVTFNEDMYPWAFTSQSIMVSDGTTTIPGNQQISSRMVIFQPDQPLQKLTTYTVFVAGSVEDMSGNPMGQLYTWQFTTKETDDIDPWVVSSKPTGTNAMVTAPIIVTFSEPMLESSVTPSTMVLYNTKLSSSVTGSVSASGATAIMMPATALQYDTDYIVTLVPGYANTPGITDLAGNPLVANSPGGYSWTFRTEPFPNPVIAATAGAGGTISPQGNILVTYGTSTTFTITPDAGYHITAVLVDGVSAGAVTSYTFANVTANHTISASFSINTYTITPSAGANGTISPPTPQSVNHNGTRQFIVTPFAGYTAVMGGTCGGALVGTTYTTNPITGNCTVQASFSLNTVTITATAGANGSISPSGTVAVDYGSNPVFTITPNAGYHVANVMIDGLSAGAVTSYMFSNVIAPHAISATFAIDTFTVAATAGSGGTISPASRVVSYSSTTTFTVTPETGYTAVMGGTCGGTPATGTAPFTYTTNQILNDCTVTANFTVNPYVLTVTKNGTGSGTVAPNSGSLAWNANVGTATYSYGSLVILTAMPADSSTQTPVVWSGCDTVNGSECTVTVNGAENITATFAINTYTITPTAGLNGTIIPSTPQIVSYGSSTTFTFTPNAGYYISAVTVDGNSWGMPTSVTLTDIRANHTVAVSFAIGSYTILATAGQGGTLTTGGIIISSGTSQDFLVTHGSSRSFTVTPNAGYSTTSILVDGATTTLNPYAFTNVTANHSISAAFALNAYTVSTSLTTTGGSISPSSAVVSHGSATVFTLLPATGYSLGPVDGCGGSLLGSTYTTGAVTGPCTVTASFMINPYTLIVTKSGTGAGTVSSNPMPVSGDVNAGSGVFNYNTPVTLTAAASTGSTFTGWSGACTGTDPCTVIMTAAQSVTATFTLNTPVLTVTRAGTAAATGTVTPNTGSLLWSGSTGTASYPYNTQVILTATASPGSMFTGWSGACTGTLPCTVTMTAAQSVTANFMLDQTFTVARAGTGAGSLASNPPPVTGDVNTSPTGTATYNYNTSVVLTAAASTGSTFTGWSGACTGTDACTVTMTEARSVTATFTLNTPVLTVTKAGTAAATALVTANTGSMLWSGNIGTAAYDYGTPVILTAAASAGSTFTGWSGEGCTGILPCTVTMTAVRNVTANFMLDQTLTVAKTGSGTISSLPLPVSGDVNTGSATYNYNASVTLTATAEAGWTFANWSGCDSSSGPLCSVTMTDARSVTATFTSTTYTLTVMNPGTGSGNVADVNNPGIFIWSEASGSGTYNYNTLVALVASPTVSSTFAGWSGEGCSGTGSCVVTMSAARNVTATFTLKSFVLDFVSGGNGTLTGTTSQTVSYNGSATAVTAVPDTGYHFVNWTGTGGFATTTTNPLTVTNVTAAQTITANFAIDTFTVSTSAGAGSIAPASVTVNYNTTTTLAVTAPPLSYITSVSGCSSAGYSNTDPTVTTYDYTTDAITGDCTVTATYALISAAMVGPRSVWT